MLRVVALPEVPRSEVKVAGKISKQVKNNHPILINGRWVHKYFDNSPPSPALLTKMAEIARRLKLHSA
jgi:hypothetical protein